MSSGHSSLSPKRLVVAELACLLKTGEAGKYPSHLFVLFFFIKHLLNCSFILCGGWEL